MQDYNDLLANGSNRILETNKVLRNTYLLLSMTLLSSAAMAGISMYLKVGGMVSMVCSITALILVWFVLPRTANSEKGLITVFAFTSLLGFGLGPILNQYLKLTNGSEIIMQALGGTGVIFLSLSAYVLNTKKDFSYMGGFLFTGMILALVAMVANIFLNIPALQLAISAAIIFIMSGFILYDTSRIINGGETNYIMATVSLYLNIYNIFINLLSLLGITNDD